jgi:histidinol-phosphatase
MTQKSPFLIAALEAVKDVEPLILEHFQHSLTVSKKADATPVTEIDLQAQQRIIELLKPQFPDHSFLGEEEGAEKKTAEYTWVIDPIDGTREYIRGVPLFGTQLALVRNNSEFILGVSNAPALGELAYAEKGGGAWLNGQRLQVSTTIELSQAFVLSGAPKYFARAGRLDALISLAEQAQGHRIFGGFWSYHLLAQGKADCMIETQTKIWDIAAVIAIVQEAGATVTDMVGEPCTLDSVDIVAAPATIHSQILKFFQS